MEISEFLFQGITLVKLISTTKRNGSIANKHSTYNIYTSQLTKQIIHVMLLSIFGLLQMQWTQSITIKGQIHFFCIECYVARVCIWDSNQNISTDISRLDNKLHQKYKNSSNFICSITFQLRTLINCILLSLAVYYLMYAYENTSFK